MSVALLHSVASHTWAVFLVVFFFGSSILVHELGHFLVARRRGVRVERFSIGFGPAIWSHRGRDGVEYRVAWIPLGGFVLIPQLADLEALEGKPSAPAAALPPMGYVTKLLILFAGAACNVLFAFALACVIWVVGQPLGNDLASTTVGYVSPTLDLASGATVPSPAAQAGLRPGDVIRAIDGYPVHDWSEITETLISGTGHDAAGNPEARMLISRDGHTLDVLVRPRLTTSAETRTVGISPAYDLIVSQVPAGSLGRRAGFAPGDVIVSFDGVPIRNALRYQDYLVDHRDRPVTARVRRDGRVVTLEIPPRPGASASPELGLLLSVGWKMTHPSPFAQIWGIVAMSYQSFKGLLSPHSNLGLSKDFAGPIGMVHIFYDAAENGLRAVLAFTIFINVSLAIINLMPIPPLDGGQIVFATIARLRGRALPIDFVVTAQLVFSVLLVSFIIYISVFDVRRWVRDREPGGPPPAAAPAKR